MNWHFGSGMYMVKLFNGVMLINELFQPILDGNDVPLCWALIVFILIFNVILVMLCGTYRMMSLHCIMEIREGA